LNAAVKNRHDPQGIRRPGRFVTAFEQIGHELLNALGAGGLGHGGIARLRQPQGKESDESDKQSEDQSCSRDGTPVAADELRGPVAQCVGPRLQRLAIQIVINIADQGFHRTVSALRILVHRGKAQNIEFIPCAVADARMLGSHSSGRRLSGFVPGDDVRSFAWGEIR
jgi:hypothetical protein